MVGLDQGIKMFKVPKVERRESENMSELHALGTALDPENQKELVGPSNLF